MYQRVKKVTTFCSKEIIPLIVSAIAGIPFTMLLLFCIKNMNGPITVRYIFNFITFFVVVVLYVGNLVTHIYATIKRKNELKQDCFEGSKIIHMLNSIMLIGITIF